MKKVEEHVDYVVEYTPFGFVIERHFLVNKTHG